MLKPEIFRQNPCMFKNKILDLEPNKGIGFHKQPCEWQSIHKYLKNKGNMSKLGNYKPKTNPT